MSHSNYPRYGGPYLRSFGAVGEEPRQTLSPPPSSPPAEHTTFDPPTSARRPGPTPARHIYAKYAQKLHPDLEPQSDFDILMLGSNKLENYTTSEKIEWLKAEWEDAIAVYGTVADAENGVQEMLDAVIELSGGKPAHDDPNVRYLRIPETDLSLRFWPGSLADAEYCVDFVVTSTREPLNVPDKYELWAIPHPATPWLEPVSTKLASIERTLGIAPANITPGAEKYILRDGMCCQLLRDGQKIMRFKVPLRVQALIADEPEDPLYEPALL